MHLAVERIKYTYPNLVNYTWKMRMKYKHDCFSVFLVLQCIGKFKSVEEFVQRIAMLIKTHPKNASALIKCPNYILFKVYIHKF